MALDRLPDWRRRLLAYLEARRSQQFAYGTNDCVAFVRGAIEAMTGADPCPDLRWTDQASAERLLALGLETTVSRYLGAPVPLRLVGRGGVVLLRHGRGLGLKIGTTACVPGEYLDHVADGDDEARVVYSIRREGLVFLPMKRFSRGWNV